MPLFNKFPYTNFHELNLDWILEQIPLFQKMRDETEGFRNETEELKHDTEHLRDETKVLHDDTKNLHDNVVEEHKQITTEITQAKNDITNTINTGKNDINTLVTNGTQQLDTIITTGKQDINTLVTSSKSAIKTLSDTSKQEITTLTENGKSAINTATATGTSTITDTVSKGTTTITGEKDKALTTISDSKDSALNAIQTQENSTLQAVSGEGAKQVKAVTDEANAKITEITTKGDEYTTTMTDLFTNTKYHADNAKASETKAQEYSEIAKTLKPLYWGGDLENLHQTLDVKAECKNAVNKASTTRWCNLLILKNATNSPDNTKEWQCKITPVTSAKANLLAWNSDGAMYVGSYDASVTDITWTSTTNLDEVYEDVMNIIDSKVSGLGTWGKKFDTIKKYTTVNEGLTSGDGVFIVDKGENTLAPDTKHSFLYMSQKTEHAPETVHFIIAIDITTAGVKDMYFSIWQNFGYEPHYISWSKFATESHVNNVKNMVAIKKTNFTPTIIRPTATVTGTLQANSTLTGELMIHGQLKTNIQSAPQLSVQLNFQISINGSNERYNFGSNFGTVWTGTGVPIYALFKYKDGSYSDIKIQVDLFPDEGTDLSILKFNTQLQ